MELGDSVVSWTYIGRLFVVYQSLTKKKKKGLTVEVYLFFSFLGNHLQKSISQTKLRSISWKLVIQSKFKIKEVAKDKIIIKMYTYVYMCVIFRILPEKKKTWLSIDTI